MRTRRAIQFLATVAASVVVTGLAFMTTKIWAGLYLDVNGTMLAAGAAAFGLPWLLNALLTRSYRKLDQGASEWNSLFGVALATHLLLMPALYLGLGGAGGAISTREALRKSAVATGILEEVDEATLEAFPMSETDTGVVWVPNVGSTQRPRVIARLESGRLKAVVLPPAGEVYDGARADFVVGPSEVGSGRVVMARIPEDVARNPRTVRLSYEGGTVTFRMSGNSRSMSIDQR